MPRAAKLGQKNGYWYTKAGNPNGQYFGKVGIVSFKDAQKQFAEYLKSINDHQRRASSSLTTLELCDMFLDWLQTHRSDRTYDERRRHLTRFSSFHVGTQQVANIPATSIQASDLTAFLDHLAKGAKIKEFTRDKHATSIKAVFNWGSKHPSPTVEIASSIMAL